MHTVEVDDAWANLYPCPSNNNEVFTCGSSGWASAVCEAQLGNYTWVNSTVTVAQLGVASSSVATLSPSPSNDTTTTKSSSTALTSSSPAECNTPLKAELGIGLGLGVPLLLAAVAMFWFYMQKRRQIQVLQQRLNEKAGGLQSGIQVRHGPPKELEGHPPKELDDGYSNWPNVHRSELS